MKDYGKIIGTITSTPWMITPEALRIMLEIFDAHLSGTISQEDIRIRLQNADGQPKERFSRHGSVGVLALAGPIFPKANLMTELSGATSLEQFRNDFRTMLVDDSIDSILLDIDSPGGLSAMVDEMATEVHEATKVKPIYAISNTAMNSAAYYIGSQANKVYSTPSGQLGSIGTYMVHTDDSERQEKLGFKDTVIKAGRFKAATIEPLTEDSHGYMQEYVNRTNDQFIGAVARGRNVTEDEVRKNFGEGGILTPTQALEAGMIDGIATFDDVVAMEGGLSQSYDADKEHSEPGTGQGGEPEPREAPEEGDLAIEGGWRRDPPPPAYEMEEIVNREWLEARASSLGIEFSEDISDEELAEKVATRVDDIVVPLADATKSAESKRAFAEAYPEEASQMEKLLAENQKNEAIKFAENYRVFSSGSKGFSPIVRGLLADSHVKVAQKSFTNEDLQTLLDATTAKEAVVPLGEAGSSRIDENDVVVPGQNMQENRQKFAELVKAAMEEDSLDQRAAMKHVADKHPDLARAYIENR